MRQMADGAGHVIVLAVVKDQRNGTQSFDKCFKAVNFFLHNFPGRRQYIVSIFNEHGFRIRKSALLGPSHGVPADKVFPDIKSRYFLMYIGLYTAYICQNTVVMKEFLHLL